MISLRQLTALAGTALLALGAAGAGESTAVEVSAAVYPCLSLRAEPRPDGRRLACLAPGTRGTALEQTAFGWTRMRLPDGREGWLSSARLEASELVPAGPAEPAPAPEPEPPAGIELPPPFAPPAAAGQLVVRRGDLRPRLLLTGELSAARATPVVVPRTRAWGVQIRWLIEDGTPVVAGDLLVEFDSSDLASQLAEVELRALSAAERLAQTRVEAEAAEAEKALAVERARIALAQARIKAEVPEELVTGREYRERQLALRRAEIDHERAREELDAHRRTTGADVSIQRLELEKAERSTARLARDLEALRLRAPASGIVLLERHLWEDRKVAVGDNLWPGMPVVGLPDLSSLEIESRLIDVDDGRLAVGARGRCRLDAYPQEAYGCRVAEISPVAQAASDESLRRGFRVRLALARTDVDRMRPGMSVAIEIEGEPHAGVLLVPRAALELAGAPRALLAAGGDEEVAIGPCNAFDCVLESGLDEGARLRPRRAEAR